jgi:hypothetical protein
LSGAGGYEVVGFLFIALVCVLLMGAVTFGGRARRRFARFRELRRYLRDGWWERLLADLSAYEEQLHAPGRRSGGAPSKSRESE